MNKQIKYALYARSNDEENIKKQVDKLTKLAKEKNLNIEVVLEDLVSASQSTGRTKFNNLIQDVENQKIDGIITINLSRLSRNTIDSGRLSYLLGSGKLKEIITTDKIFKRDESILSLMVSIGMGNQFLNTLSKMTKRGLKKKASDGDFPSKAPLGYKNDGLEKKIIKDIEIFSLVKNIFNSFIKDGSLKKIIKNNEFKKLKLNKTKLTTLLLNVFYTGNFIYLGTLYKGNHEAIISLKEHNSIKKLLNS